MMASTDTPAEGGRYEIDKRGRRKRVEPPTQDHPEGNRPRPAPLPQTESTDKTERAE